MELPSKYIARLVLAFSKLLTKSVCAVSSAFAEYHFSAKYRCPSNTKASNWTAGIGWTSSFKIKSFSN